MKKFIQVLSLLSLAIVLTVVSANAQKTRQYKAQIPYDFNVSEKAYKAGDYIIKVAGISNNVFALTLEDTEKNKLQTVLVRENANSAENESKLHFTTYDNRRFLTELSVEKAGVRILVPRKAARADKNREDEKPAEAAEKPGEK